MSKRAKNEHFERIKNRYNFPIQKWYSPLVESIRAENNGNIGRVLDVGCGGGIAGDSELAQWTVEEADEVIGVDPSVKPTQAPSHLDSFVQAPLEKANLPEGYFDLAYSFMVMEHVKNPEKFFSALKDTIRVGGVYIFTTPNPQSVFGLSVRAFKQLRIANEVKSLLKDGCGLRHELGYKLKSEKDFENAAKGFECEFSYSETYESYKSYFPKIMRPIWHALKVKRSLWKEPSSLAQMTARCIRVE